eukprot:CAMPEP_0173224780 /NCGR_PEP_ID=MMETSP1142-20121109/4535_1 /TAXON_ID=483371 /ORGANISM="non described non described, Strain CCMP2298" /LENGTH=48 /DNA_ID= /DNA_START= /DNA_END= /DNA_ORIENTATION=
MAWMGENIGVCVCVSVWVSVWVYGFVSGLDEWGVSSEGEADGGMGAAT